MTQKTKNQTQLVTQDDRFGCIVACAAMVLGKTYAEVRKDWFNNFTDEGATFDQLMNYLGDQGFSVVHKMSRFYIHKDVHRKEMLTPFAPIHVISVQPCFDTPQNHVVVMTEDGTLLCPDGATDAEIRESYAVTDVIGLYR